MAAYSRQVVAPTECHKTPTIPVPGSFQLCLASPAFIVRPSRVFPAVRLVGL